MYAYPKFGTLQFNKPQKNKTKHRPFREALPVIYFNKKDIFSQKLQEFPLQNVFKDYCQTGIEETLEFISQKFVGIPEITNRYYNVHSPYYNVYRFFVSMIEIHHGVFPDTTTVIFRHSLIRYV